jgi:D-amino-acid dehydrogenase
MASIAVSEFLPSSRPSVWSQIPRWLIDPEGPVRLRVGYLPRLTPWLLRFLAAGLPARVRALEAAGAALCARVYDDLLPLLDAAGLSDMLSREGCLSLYADEAEYAADQEHLAAIARHGFATQLLSARELRELEPAISPAIAKAVLLPQNRSISDPYQLVSAFAERFQAAGGRIEHGEVTGFDHADNRVAGIRLRDGRRIAATQVVLCAGAYTAQL